MHPATGGGSGGCARRPVDGDGLAERRHSAGTVHGTFNARRSALRHQHNSGGDYEVRALGTLFFVLVCAVCADRAIGEPRTTDRWSAAATKASHGWRVWSDLANANALPDPQSQVVLMWLVAGLGGLVVALGSLSAAVLAIFAVFDRIKGRRETLSVDGCLETRASKDGPDRIEFGLHVKGFEDFRAESRAVREELKGMIESVSEKLDRYSSDNYKRRRAMHREINSQREALAFLAGQLSARGDETAAAHLRDLIRVRSEDEERAE